MYLLDTNALSELVKKRPHPGFIQRLRRHPADAFFVRHFQRIPNLRVENWTPSRT